MGMFDYVEYSYPCPVCGEVITGWQSKDGPCQLLLLQPRDVRSFYNECGKCGTWVDMKVTVQALAVELEGFERKSGKYVEAGEEDVNDTGS